MPKVAWDAMGALVPLVTFLIFYASKKELFNKARDYMYTWRFPDSKFVPRLSLNDTDISPDDNLHKLRSESAAWLRHLAGNRCWTIFLDLFNVLEIPPPSHSGWLEKPSQLLLEKKYLLTDAQTLFICLFSVSLGRSTDLCLSKDDGRGGQKAYCDARVKVTFRRPDNICLAHIQFSNINVHEISLYITQRNIREYRRIIIDGYPPWYKMKVKNKADKTFNFPSLENGNLKRGGWIVAIGLGDLEPLPYFSSKLASFYQFRDGSRGHHREGGEGPYVSAYRHLQSVFKERFSDEAFSGDEDKKIIETTQKTVDEMIKEHSASVFRKFVKDCSELAEAYTPGGYAEELESMELEEAIRLFNDRSPLNADQISFLKLKLKPVMAGVLRGLRSFFSYFNDIGYQIDDGIQEMIQNNPDIYLEGC